MPCVRIHTVVGGAERGSRARLVICGCAITSARDLLSPPSQARRCHVPKRVPAFPAPALARVGNSWASKSLPYTANQAVCDIERSLSYWEGCSNTIIQSRGHNGIFCDDYLESQKKIFTKEVLWVVISDS
jgi:hypothetical protein